MFSSTRMTTPSQPSKLVPDPYSPSAADVVEAIDVSRRVDLSFWDALIIVAATRTGSDVVLTEDLNHRQVVEGVRIENPFV